MAYLDIRCPHCGATGRVHNETNSAFLMGRCPVCGGYVVYFCGAALAIDENVLETHCLEYIRDHIIEQIDEFLSERITGFLEEYAEELDIDLDLEPGSEDCGHEEEDDEINHQIKARSLLPEPRIAEPPNAHGESGSGEDSFITAEDVRDFVEIDLHLIDQSWYFEKYFG